MATIGWLGLDWEQEGSDGFNPVYSWTLADNWSGGKAPLANDSVVIGAGVPSPVLQSAISLSNLTIYSGQTLTVGAFADHRQSTYAAGRLAVTHTLGLDGALEIDAAAGSAGGSSLNVAGTLAVAQTGALSLGCLTQTTATNAWIAAITNLGQIDIAGSATAASTLVVYASAGFGLAGALTGDIQLSGAAKIDFVRGGDLSTIANSGALSLSGAGAGIFAGAHGAANALAALGEVDGDLSLSDDAALRIDDALTIGDGADMASVQIDSGASLLATGAVTINAAATLDLGQGARAYASTFVIDDGVFALETGARIAAPIVFTGAGGTLSLHGQTLLAISGSNGTIDADDSTFNLSGGGFTANLTGSTVATFLDTGADADTVVGTPAHIFLQHAQIDFYGSAENIVADGAGNVVTLFGGFSHRIVSSNGAVNLMNAQTQIIGGGNLVTFDGEAGNEATLFATDSVADTVVGSNGSLYLSGAQALVSGGDDKIFLRGSPDNLAVESTGGSADLIDGSQSDILLSNAAAVLSQGSGNAVAFASGTDDVLTLTEQFDDTIYASGGRIVATDDFSATIVGGGDSVAVGRPFGFVRELTLENTAGAADTVSIEDAQLTLLNADANITGYDYRIHLWGGTSNVTISASDDSYINFLDNYDYLNNTFGAGQINLQGGSLQASGQNLVINFVSGFNDLSLIGYQASASYSDLRSSSGTVNGSNGNIDVYNDGSGRASFTINGDDDIVAALDGSTIQLNGTAEQLYAYSTGNIFYGFNASDVINVYTDLFANWQALQAALSQQGDDTVIAASGNGTSFEVTLKNVEAFSLTQSEFMFH